MRDDQIPEGRRTKGVGDPFLLNRLDDPRGIKRRRPARIKLRHHRRHAQRRIEQREDRQQHAAAPEQVAAEARHLDTARLGDRALDEAEIGIRVDAQDGEDVRGAGARGQGYARRTDADNESAGYKFEGVIDRNTNAASTALVGAVTKTVLAEDTVAWDCDVTADTTNGALSITVTGEAAKSIKWTGFVTIAESNG